MEIIVTLADGSSRKLVADEGLSVMEVLRDAGLIEGECNGSLACASCHVWVDKAWNERLGETSEDEEDMLDVAFNLAPTSRLSCQIFVGPATNGIRVALPKQV